MKESGIGRENGVEAFESCKFQPYYPLRQFRLIGSRHADSQSRSTIVNIASVEDTRINDDWFTEDSSEKRYG
jgi:hypothetical protein